MIGASQGPCETTLTERFAYDGCRCGTYEGNLGPCKTYEIGASGRCVYCDHGAECHNAIKTLKDKIDWVAAGVLLGIFAFWAAAFTLIIWLRR